jgi:hypothetical protein
VIVHGFSSNVPHASVQAFGRIMLAEKFVSQDHDRLGHESEENQLWEWSQSIAVFEFGIAQSAASVPTRIAVRCAA